MIDSSLIASSPESVGIDPSALEALFERAGKEVREGTLPSVQIAIAREGKIAGMRTFGRATFGGVETDAHDDSLYCVFSCTKAITSAAAWLLIQEGKLSVDEQVSAIIPEFGSHGKDAVRVEQLFTHTAGFPTAPFNPKLFRDRERRLESFASWRLNFEPGSRFIYHPSSSMYVIADIIEQRSGMPYHDFVRQRIAEPLGLPDLFVGLPDEEQARAADIEHRGQELTDADFEELGFPKPPVTEVTEESVQSFNRAEVRRAGIPGALQSSRSAPGGNPRRRRFHECPLAGSFLSGAPLWRKDRRWRSDLEARDDRDGAGDSKPRPDGSGLRQARKPRTGVDDCRGQGPDLSGLRSYQFGLVLWPRRGRGADRLGRPDDGNLDRLLHQRLRSPRHSSSSARGRDLEPRGRLRHRVIPLAIPSTRSGTPASSPDRWRCGARAPAPLPGPRPC